MSDTERLRGVGGWLGLYIFFGFSALLWIPAVIFTAPYFSIPSVLFIVFGAVICFFLLKQRSDAVKWVRLFLLAKMGWYAAFLIFYFVLFAGLFFSGGNYYIAVFDIKATSGTILISWIWFMYFEKSVRVKLTFPEAFSLEPNRQAMQLWTRMGIAVIGIFMLSMLFSTGLSARINPMMKERLKKMSLNEMRQNIGGVGLRNEALRNLWESKHGEYHGQEEDGVF